MSIKTFFALVLITLVLVIGCSKLQVGPKVGSSSSGGQSEIQRCTAGAKGILGESATVVRCGSLSGAGGLEALAVKPLSNSPQPNGALAASRVVVIQQQGSEWIIELDAVKEIMNPVGYIGLDFIDDSYSLILRPTPPGQPTSIILTGWEPSGREPMRPVVLQLRF